MESLAQQVQNALAPYKIRVYLGEEWLSRTPELPHLIVLPGGGTYTPPDGRTRDALAGVQQRTNLLARAVTFEQATLLAEVAYAAAAPGRGAELDLGTELWGDNVIRTATLTITLPAVLTRSDVTRVRIEQVLAHHRYLTPPQEAPDEQTDQSYTATFE